MIFIFSASFVVVLVGFGHYHPRCTSAAGRLFRKTAQVIQNFKKAGIVERYLFK
jgi:hypothetical protein